MNSVSKSSLKGDATTISESIFLPGMGRGGGGDKKGGQDVMEEIVKMGSDCYK